MFGDDWLFGTKYVSELKAVLPEVDIFLGSGDLLKCRNYWRVFL